ncbi:MAG: murein biosynthesis integral membrane protein MurJ [Inquilinus sp.]|nr:murein biosynthesis integral membrane protein MurJ [Inquilinus sp.]
MALLRSVATIGGFTMTSRVLGLVRDVLISNVVDKSVTDAFFVAFTFPNLFRRLFAEGAFNAAFVPQFARRLTAEGRAAALRFGNEVAGVMTAWLLLMTALVIAAMPWLAYGVAPGFADEPEKFALTIELTRLTFPYLMFMALTAMLAGMLNSIDRFAAAAAAPILLNLMFIGALIMLMAGLLPLPGHALAWAVALAGALQFAWLAAACARHGIMVRLPWPRLTRGVRRLFRLMLPAVLGAGAMQINMLINQWLATFLPEGSVSYLYYADRLNQLPLGVVGVSVAVALLPMMARQIRSGDDAAAIHSQNRAIEIALVLTVPAAVALVVLAEPLISIIFERGRFTPDMTPKTAAAVAAFVIGLPAYVMTRALTPGFFAREDTVTPFRVSVVVVVASIALALALMPFLLHVGIALATALTAWLNAGLLAFILYRRRLFAVDRRLRRKVPRILLSAGLMGAAVWGVAGWLEAPLAGPFWLQVPALAAIVALGVAVYFVLAHLTGAATLGDLKSSLRKPSA